MEGNPTVTFWLNGEKQEISPTSNVSAGTVLVDYIRDVANLKGTKVMCREGGCGACTVTARLIHSGTGMEVVKSVNACLTPVLSCDGWDISTVERLGNKHEGYHAIQSRIVNFHGTQCGFCTPGMVMNMYCLLESKKNVRMEDVERNLDGNICRCTGYRPILEAFKSLAVDAPPELQQKCLDIEDCATCPLKKGEVQCAHNGGERIKLSLRRPIQLDLNDGASWVVAKTLEDALAAAESIEGVRFIAGNTSTGIFKEEGPYRKYIDINGIRELGKTTVDESGIILGGGVTLTEMINFLKTVESEPGLEYGGRVAAHLERVANVSVRNNASIAGNLMIKHKHNEFPSDVFVLLEALDAKMTLVTKCSTSSSEKAVAELEPVSMLEFLATDMNGKLIKSIHLPRHDGSHFRSFKITRRYQNAHAYVNAALLLKIDKGSGFFVKNKPRLVYGGISPSFIHATAAETALEGKTLTDKNTLKIALEALEKEVEPEGGPLESSKEYRVQLVKSLLYKTILEIVGDRLPAKIKSGAGDIPRNLSSSRQYIDSDPSNTTLYKYVPKYEAGIQASGEAEYIGDIPIRPDELYAAFVQSTVAVADVVELDASEALKFSGVTHFITAKDVPGINDGMKFNFFPSLKPEPIFAESKVEYHGQALGLILATSRELAMKAAKLVKVTYANPQKPVISIDEAIQKAKAEGTYSKQNMGLFKTKPLEDRQPKHKLSGVMKTGSQYHFHMETQSVVCHPREDGIDVFCSTQWVDHCQDTIATVLGIPTNSVNLKVRRLGGGFGGKTTLIASACAVATWVTNRPVRLILDLETNMTMFGKRLPYMIPYEVGFDDLGRIGSLNLDFIADCGYAMNEPNSYLAAIHVQSVYKAVGWKVDTHIVSTNTPANTACRAPGSVKAVAVIEWIMEHIAHYLGKDPIEVREKNLLETGDAMLHGPPIYERVNMIPEMLERMRRTADYGERKQFVDTFNRENRWKKRGMAVVPVRYGIGYWATNMPASVVIYQMDGSVAVSTGGIEMGQGLNTKVIQVVANGLGVPIDRIKVKPTNNFTGANSFLSGGTIASEMACYSVMRACEEIRENLRPILEKLENPTWEELVREAHQAKVKLTASYTPTAKDDLKGYYVWVLSLAEVEIDVLTGEYKVVRTDLYEDTGKSLSPGVDLGQIEGGYIHGQGYWTTEKVVHDEETGRLLTNGTWDYKVPESKDIPEDFRITLLSNVPNPTGILRSKATGEPSTDAAFAVVLAMRNAIASARADTGNMDWFEMSGPVTPEDIARLCLTKESDLTF